MKRLYDKIMGDSLYKNSIYLMLSSAIMAGFGFFSWLIIARLFDVHNVGLATTMISVMGLISSLSVLGFNTGLIRFLPTSKRKNEKINTGFTLVLISTIIITSIFLIGINTFSPELAFIKDNMIISFIFILFMIVYAFSTLIESIFIAFRSTKFILIKNSIFGILRLGLPFLFIGFGAFGIFSSYVSAMLIGFGVVFFVLIHKFDYKPKLVFYDKIIKKIGKYSLGNFIAGFIGSLSLLILPLMITNIINPTTTAYYFMAMQIASLLYVIPTATTNSLFAEGSRNEKSLGKQTKKSIKIISALLIPSIIIIILFGDYILLAFGEEYSTAGFNFLKIMAISGIFTGINAIFGGIFRVKKRITSIIIVSAIGAIVILGGSYWLIGEGMGLIGIGYAYLTGQIVMNVCYAGMKIVRRKK